MIAYLLVRVRVALVAALARPAACRGGVLLVVVGVGILAELGHVVVKVPVDSTMTEISNLQLFGLSIVK